MLEKCGVKRPGGLFHQKLTKISFVLNIEPHLGLFKDVYFIFTPPPLHLLQFVNWIIIVIFWNLNIKFMWTTKELMQGKLIAVAYTLRTY